MVCMRFGGMVALVFLASCISMSDREKQENVLETPCIETAGFMQGEWPSKDWWEVFDSPQLSALVVTALANNPSIQGVEKRLDAAKEVSKIARARLFPLVFFDVEETSEFLSKNGLYKAFNPSLPIHADLLDITLNFSYEFDFWGKNRNLFRASLNKARAEAAEAAQVALIATTALAQGYFALKANLIKHGLIVRLVDVRRKTFQLQALLEKSALNSQLEPLLSQERVFDAEKQLSSIEEEIAVGQHLVNILAGLGPDSPLEIDEDMPLLPPSIAVPHDISANLLARRPDLMAEIWRVEALADEVGAAKADFYPNINLGAFFGFESVILSKIFNADSQNGGFTPALNLPIFTAGAIRANVKAKKAAFDEAVYAYNQLLLQSASEVADFLSFARDVYEKKRLQEEIVENAQIRFDLTLLRSFAGLDSFIEKYAFEEVLIQKKLEDVDLLYSQYLALIKLTKSLGGGYGS